MSNTAIKEIESEFSANYTATTNACKLCKPLGATLAFRGIAGAIPFLHGSQGCATYMRRYIISHFREPVDIASSSLGEKHAVYGGGPNFKLGLINVMKKYGPSAIGIATTCLTETIGDDVRMFLYDFRKEMAAEGVELPPIVTVSTPSYGGTHMEGFHAAVRAIAEQLAEPCSPNGKLGLFPGFVSAADLRHLRDIFTDFGLEGVFVPDYSETLDGPALEDYEKIPSGGTTVEEIRSLGGAGATLVFGRALPDGLNAGMALRDKLGVPTHRIGLPIGLRESDTFFETLEALSECPIPRRHVLARGRLVDAYVDGHKYIFGKKAIVYGEEDLVVGLVAFLSEIGVKTVLAASGGTSGNLAKSVAAVTDGLMPEPPLTLEGVDFYEIAGRAEALAPDLIIGNSKGYRMAKALDIPLIRVGFPIHDRFGGQRIRHLGYDGTQDLFDRVVNACIEVKQSRSEIGYGYM